MGICSSSASTQVGPDVKAAKPVEAEEKEKNEGKLSNSNLEMLYTKEEANEHIKVIQRVCPRKMNSDMQKMEIRIKDNDKRELSFAYVSQTGYYPDDLRKPNQDSVKVVTTLDVPNGDQYAFFGVFDGHGSHGDKCSIYASELLVHNLQKDTDFVEGRIEKGLKNAFLKTNMDMHNEDPLIFNDQMSGTTAIVVLLKGDTIYCANVGDSRAISCIAHDGRMLIEPLSIDQTPFRKDERARVKACGARVLTTAQLTGEADPTIQEFGTEEDNDGDPPRVWHKTAKYPGTAFTRSLGDRVAEELGVNAEPEIFCRKFESYDRYLLLASDGVFEFLSSQGVADIVSEYIKNGDLLRACHAIVAESYRLWLQYEVRTDDISVIIVDVADISKSLMFTGRPSIFTRSNSSAINHLAQTIIAQEEMIKLGKEYVPERHKSGDSIKVATEEWVVGMRPVRRKVTSRNTRIKFDPSELEGYSLPVYEKSEEEKKEIAEVVRTNFLFSHLNEEQLGHAINAMETVLVEAGQVIIKQFDIGDKFYVTKSGKYTVEVAVPKPVEDDASVSSSNVLEYSEPEVVMEYDCSLGGHPSFGELALMYDKPRAATITATEKGELWALERNAFRSICMKTPYHKMLNLLKKVDVFEKLSNSALTRLVDKASHISYQPGDCVVKQGDHGDSFYVIKSGRADVKIKDETSGDENIVMQLNQNSYFGERALINDAPRAATVIATEPLSCLVITREIFDEVLGHLQEELHNDGVTRERIAAIINSSISIDHLFIYERPISETEKLFHCKFRDEQVEEDADGEFKTHFSTLRVMEKSKEVSELEAIKKEQEIFAHLSTPFLTTSFSDERYHYQLFRDEILLPLPLKLNSIRELKFVLKSICSAVVDMHQNKILHRSICPDAIFLDNWGEIKIMSYNFAKILDTSRTYTLCGIPEYMAPEVVRNIGYGYPVDWWSVGMTAFELCCGKPLCEAENEQKIYEMIASLNDENSPIDEADFPFEFEEAKAFIKLMIKQNPEDRPNYKFQHDLEGEKFFRKVSIGNSPFQNLVNSSKDAYENSEELNIDKLFSLSM